MGCGGSKLDGLEAVSLCRTRHDLLAAAIRRRYALSAAHSAHAASLRSVAAALHRLLLSSSSATDIPHPIPDSHSGSHIDFHSDSDSDSESPLHSGHGSPAETLPPPLVNLRDQPPPPSVSFEQRPEISDAVKFEPPNYYSYGGMGEFFGPNSPPSIKAAAFSAPSSSASRLPPPPPSPPKSSNWDFLNPFHAFDADYTPYNLSQSSKEEQIPELEEVVKVAYSDQKFTPSISNESKTAPSHQEGAIRTSSVGSISSSEDEDDVVEKKVAHEEPKSVAASSAPIKYGDVSVVAEEMKAQFDRAAEAAMELSRMFEVGKYPYRQANSVYEASSRMMSVMTSPSSSKNGEQLIYEEDMVMNSRSLSSSLHKLYMWEKKLYDEVKSEEKLRLLHDKKCKQLTDLVERGAEAHKIDITRSSVRKLSTKMRIAIQVVDSISKKITKLKEDELWPQINEIIQGLTKMWKVMVECYRTPSISESKAIESIAAGGNLSGTRMDQVMQLELELLRWIGNFSDWINAQKNFVKSLNEWLALSLNYEPEVTPDGVPPYSPGRIGAPPLYVTSNYWSQAMDQLSEKGVVDAMQSFASSLLSLCDQVGLDQREKMQTIQKEQDAVNKKLVLASGQNGTPLYESGNLHLGLKKMFEAMEDFAASSLKAYEELQLSSKGVTGG